MSTPFIVGIDLGTTHTSVAYVGEKGRIETLSIPQWVAPGEIGSSQELPSCLYLAQEGELPEGSLQLPWQSEEQFRCVGALARDRGASRPEQLVSSAKSWLSLPAAARKEKILPIADPAVSPLEASSAYLRHIAQAWEWSIAKGDPELALEEQRVILTIPASFDEVARRLTLEAAIEAGLRHVTLLEEPQSAFYSWLLDHKEPLEPGSVVLVVDVGGGTTDFSAIEVTEGGFSRSAVGDHLLLGGDNMDLAIAHLVEQQLGPLEPGQWHSLCHQARLVKEGRAPTFVIEGQGSGLVGGSRKVEIARERIDQLLMEGFFGQMGWEEARAVRRRSALRGGGLPFERESSIVKQLAHFLDQAKVRPTHILFNGGTMRPSAFQEAICENVARWFGPIEILPDARLSSAVARGAAHFGRTAQEDRIKGGIARGIYLGVGGASALTLLPRASEGGALYEPDEPFQLKANEPVSFCLYTSQVRLEDQPGDLVDLDEEQFTMLPPIYTRLRFGKGKGRYLPVRLRAEMTEVGVVEISLGSLESDHRWQLDFQMRSSSSSKVEAGLDQDTMERAEELLIERWRSGTAQVFAPTEELLDLPRVEWPLSLIRRMWDRLIGEPGHRDARWWNLIGFLLRPGSGAPLDEFRTRQLWQLILSEGQLKEEIEVQRVICFRRIAAGLSAGQQMQLVSRLQKGRAGKFLQAERQRTLASFELLPRGLKQSLAEVWLEAILEGRASEAERWALSRIGARRLLYGSVGHVIPRSLCAEWVERLLDREPIDAKVVASLAKRTAVREHDLPRPLLERVAQLIDRPDLLDLVAESVEEESALLGDQLPAGLSLN